jgi:hypothetical protein
MILSFEKLKSCGELKVARANDIILLHNYSPLKLITLRNERNTSKAAILKSRDIGSWHRSWRISRLSSWSQLEEGRQPRTLEYLITAGSGQGIQAIQKYPSEKRSDRHQHPISGESQID